jgi:hypothetical protein
MAGEASGYFQKQIVTCLLVNSFNLARVLRD